MPIEILPVEIQHRIAAGEVVERPASVVKELVENAIDAGARAISIEVQDGGRGLIRVSDDGCGISRQEVRLAMTRFATSKIAALPDLDRIHTLGFRGEALSSIAAVAQVEILTRTETELEGSRVSNKTTAAEPAASPPGTSITVRHLFAHIPARHRFLKSRMRENELIRKAVDRYALIYPKISFRLVIDGRTALIAPASSQLARIGVVLGRDIADEMVSIEWQAIDLTVKGYISRPTIGRSRRSEQFFSVNGRPIRSGLLAVMVERPYTGRLVPGRHPLCTVQIEIDPAYVDVNVHPQKAEVRFSQERAVYGALSNAVNTALSSYPRQTEWAGGEGIVWPFAAFSAEGTIGESPAGYETWSMRALAQLHNLYILSQSPEGLVIVDQHAAHEQILFEQIMSGSPRFELPTPQTLALTPRESEVLEKIISLLTELGIEIEPFGTNHFLIRSLPTPLKACDGPELVSDLIVTTKEKNARGPSLREHLATRMACLGAVKAGDQLTLEQMQHLLDELGRIWSPATCPHGRPAMILLAKEELDRRFNRD